MLLFLSLRGYAARGGPIFERYAFAVPAEAEIRIVLKLARAARLVGLFGRPPEGFDLDLRAIVDRHF